MEFNKPTISVIMPVYNSEKYLFEAIRSVLCQTYSDFEFLIFDDASTDNSLDIIRTFNDKRIKLIIKPENTGYTDSLNMGLEVAKGKYIARMDSDDICEENRFEIQLKFLEENPEVAVCGSWFKFINNDTIIKHPLSNDEIKITLLSYCALGHPTVMIRNSFIKNYVIKYDRSMEPSEDYDLWARICIIGKLANIPKVLLHYRIHETQVSTTRITKQKEISNRVRINLLMNLLPNHKINYSLLQFETIKSTSILFFKEIHERLLFLNALKNANDQLNIFELNLFMDFIKNEKKKIVLSFFHDYRAYNIKILFNTFIKGRSFFQFVDLSIIFKYIFKSLIGYQNITNESN